MKDLDEYAEIPIRFTIQSHRRTFRKRKQTVNRIRVPRFLCPPAETLFLFYMLMQDKMYRMSDFIFIAGDSAEAGVAAGRSIPLDLPVSAYKYPRVICYFKNIKV